MVRTCRDTSSLRVDSPVLLGASIQCVGLRVSYMDRNAKTGTVAFGNIAGGRPDGEQPDALDCLGCVERSFLLRRRPYLRSGCGS